MKLLKISSSIEKKDWDIKFSDSGEVNSDIVRLGFVRILNKNIPNGKLFLQDEYINSNVTTNENTATELTSFPIYELDFQKHGNRRQTVDEFKDYLVENSLQKTHCNQTT